MTKIKIVYLKTSWPENIGNAFIDIGSVLSIKKAIKNAAIYPISAYPYRLFSRGPQGLEIKVLESIPNSIVYRFKRLFGKHLDRIEKKVLRNIVWRANDMTIKNALDLLNLVRADYFIASGMILSIEFFNIFYPFLLELKRRSIKIVFYGVGGLDYQNAEVVEIRKKIKEIGPYALISRDSIAYSHYKDLAVHSYDGIDCAFFLNELPIFQEFDVNLSDYIVFNFDKYEYLDKYLEPKFGNHRIVRTSHFFHKNPKSRFNKEDMLISDSPFDYLLLYGHAKEVHADRVHACVSALSFGNPCRLYTNIPSAALFTKIGAEDVTEKLVYPDIERIRKEKQKQIDFLSQVIV